MKKKTVKKLLSVSLVSAMTVVLLAGCGGGSDSGDSGSDEGRKRRWQDPEGGSVRRRKRS